MKLARISQCVLELDAQRLLSPDAAKTLPPMLLSREQLRRIVGCDLCMDDSHNQHCKYSETLGRQLAVLLEISPNLPQNADSRLALLR